MTQWACEDLSEFGDAIYYESKFFSNDIRILAYTVIDFDYIAETRLHLKQIKRKYAKLGNNPASTMEIGKICGYEPSDISLASDSEQSSGTDKDYNIEFEDKLAAKKA